MKGYLTGHDLANTVRMAHSQRRITFLLVEGTTDATLFRRFVHRECEVLACHGRPNALLATTVLDESQEAGFLTFVDADWDRASGQTPISANCVWTDHHDLIVDLLCSPAFGHLLAERGSAGKIAAYEACVGKSVSAVVIEEAAALGRLRWHNESVGLSLKFADLEVHGWVEEEGLRLDFVEVVRVVVQRSGTLAPAAELRGHCDVLAARGVPASQVASGHDAVAILGVGLRKTLGSQRAQDVRVDVLELELRLAFGWESMKQTSFYAEIRAWEARNAGWHVLREEDAA